MGFKNGEFIVTEINPTDLIINKCTTKHKHSKPM